MCNVDATNATWFVFGLEHLPVFLFDSAIGVEIGPPIVATLMSVLSPSGAAVSPQLTATLPFLFDSLLIPFSVSMSNIKVSQ